MAYADIHNWLGWPDPEQAFMPSGAGAKAFTEFAQKKFQGALDFEHPGAAVKIGIIATDPHSDNSEAPLALVCDFPRAASEAVLDLVHKLAWNLSRTALLITLEPHRLIAWSCYQDPTQGERRRVCELPEVIGFKPTGTPEQQQVRDLLHWVNLITSRAQNDQPEKFPTDGRADALLLKNLRYVRGKLLEMRLSQDHCHDLLARIIFTQFLFHRRDSDGRAFLSPPTMRRLQEDGTLSKYHEDLASLLSHKTDTYALFSWLDGRFNGDLFPGKDGDDESEHNAAWKTEKDAVTKEHLNVLADLISGDMVAEYKQPLLWKHYYFDAIPLEFISSVYEEFLTANERGNDKAYYTPSHLVDYVLDAVLPWDSEDWNIRILDPCCGSGIFLVKAFQRIIHRWRKAHPDRQPLVTDLRPILARNLVGVDKNKEAVRVACFSLYLAMADAIEPKHYITRDNSKVFPRLRGTRLIHRDFFDEATIEIRTEVDRESFDLVLGNAPWGDGSVFPDKEPGETIAEYRTRIRTLPPTPAQTWSKENGWPLANNDIGPLFLAKAAALVKPSGFVAMINTASLLYWRDGQAMALRKKLFTSFTFEEVTNLSALRRELFPQAIGPSCIVVFKADKPDEQQTLHYYTPKPTRSLMTPARGKPTVTKGFSIEPNDIALISHLKAYAVPWVWSALAIGGYDHLELILRLSNYTTFEKLESKNEIETRKGVILGDQKKRLPDEFQTRRFFDNEQFPEDIFLEMDASSVPLWENPRIDARGSVDFGAFASPQMLIKQGFPTQTGRFRAVLVKSDDPKIGVICKETYVSVHDLDSKGVNIRAACAAYNSKFAVCFFALTSGSFPLYISKVSVGELLQLPLPQKAPDLSTLDSFDAIDEATRKMFGFTAADWTLIEDFLKYTLPDVLRKTPGPARFQTQRKAKDGTKEPELTEYTKTFARVIKGTFGKDKSVTSTVFTDPDGRKLPVRMVTIHLDALGRLGVTYQAIEADGLLDILTEFHTGQLTQKTRAATGSGLGFQRVAYFFRPSRESGNRVMNVTIVKPDECRYWTRSMAMRDADQISAALRKAAVARNKNA